MIFHITISHCKVLRTYISFKFCEDLFVSLAENIREYIQTTTVSHSFTEDASIIRITAARTVP